MKTLRQYPLNVLARRVIRGWINPWLLRLTARHDYDVSSTLVIAGSPRSGTTWLAELVGMIPRAAILFEPLHVRKVAKAAAAGFQWQTYVEPDEAWAQGETFFRRILRGQVLSSWTTSSTKLSHAIRPRVWVVKLVHANLLLGWLARRFPIRPPALIVRHPCATIASQLQHGWTMKHAPRAPKFFAAHPDLADLVDHLTEQVELLAARWCIQNYVPLALPRPYPFHLVSYERLVRDGERELARIFDLWGIEVPGQARKRLRLPSQTTKRHSQLHQRSDPLAGWRKTLSDCQIAQILRVVEAFGLDFYSDALEPDYDRLYGPSPLRTLSVPS